MPGYSGTPLAKKLGIKDGLRVSLATAPAEVRSELKAALVNCEVVDEVKAMLDFAMFFTKSSGDLKNGRRYRQHYHFLIEFRDGRISAVREYLDTQHAHDVWLGAG